MSNNKAKYIDFCSLRSDIPLFMKPWWLDALAGVNAWDVAIAEKGGSIVGVMPYVRQTKMTFTSLAQPKLTQFLGPWILKKNAADQVNVSYYRRIMDELIGMLPSCDRYLQCWSPKIIDWMPFYWAGYSQTTKYSYFIRNNLSDKQLWSGLKSNVRGDIKKAKDRYKLEVIDDVDFEVFLKLHNMVFTRQSKSVPYSVDLLLRLEMACIENSARKIFGAIDGNGVVHAVVYVVWDANTTYYLMGGSDPHLRGSGAVSLCLFEAIRFSLREGRDFDFEGSMIEPIEKHFRAFGSVQRPYYRVSKTYSLWLRVGLGLLSIFRGTK